MLKKWSLKKVDNMFYTDQTPVEMWPTHHPLKFFFYQNGSKWPKMHFGSIFFFSGKWVFFRPTHPLNLENSRFFFWTLPFYHFFLKPSLNPNLQPQIILSNLPGNTFFFFWSDSRDCHQVRPLDRVKNYSEMIYH